MNIVPCNCEINCRCNFKKIRIPIPQSLCIKSLDEKKKSLYVTIERRKIGSIICQP